MIGQYVITDFVEPTIAAALANEHAAIISRPGWGKTKAIYLLSLAIAGADRSLLLPLFPSTPPSRIEGRVNLAKAVNGIEEMIYDGTAFSDALDIVILDELFRTNTANFDILLPLLEPYGEMERQHGHKTILATSNWLGSSERLEALRNRFGLIVRSHADLPEVGALVSDALEGTESDEELAEFIAWVSESTRIPSWNDILDVRASRAPAETRAAIGDYIRTLYQETLSYNSQERTVSKIDTTLFDPRRITQMANICFRYGSWIHGSTRWDTIPTEVARVMEHALPVLSEEEASAWKIICRNIGNQPSSASKAILSEALNYYRGLEKEYLDTKATDRAAQVGITARATERLAVFEEQLRETLGEESEAYNRGVTMLEKLLGGVLNRKDLNEIAKEIFDDAFGD